jgi:hypothetical protein
MAQRGAMTRHNAGFFDARCGYLSGVGDPRLQRRLLWWQPCRLHSKIPQATRPFGCRSGQALPVQTTTLVLPYGVGVGDGLLNAGCGVLMDEEPHPVRPLPAF